MLIIHPVIASTYNQNRLKSESSEIVISPLIDTVETSVYLFLHTFAKESPGRQRVKKSLTLIEPCRFQLTLKID